MVAKRVVTVVVCLFLILPITIVCKDKDAPIYTGKEKISLIRSTESRNSFVYYVKIKGKKYLVKQKKDPKRKLAVVRDALAAYIARVLGIAHLVAIIPFDVEFPGKVQTAQPATVHTLAPGDTVRSQVNIKYSALRLRQFWANAQTFCEKGLTREIITFMTWHKQLPKIVALDLLIGNSDRHCGNLCYDPETDMFCAIDMDDTFNKDLCMLACEKLHFMVEQQQVIFTAEEIVALQSMKSALKYLIRKNKLRNVIEQLNAFAQRAGFFQGSPIYNKSIAKKLAEYQMMITQTYVSADKLIELIDKIVAQRSLERNQINDDDIVT